MCLYPLKYLLCCYIGHGPHSMHPSASRLLLFNGIHILKRPQEQYPVIMSHSGGHSETFYPCHCLVIMYDETVSGVCSIPINSLKVLQKSCRKGRMLEICEYFSVTSHVTCVDKVKVLVDIVRNMHAMTIT